MICKYLANVSYEDGNLNYPIHMPNLATFILSPQAKENPAARQKVAIAK